MEADRHRAGSETCGTVGGLKPEIFPVPEKGEKPSERCPSGLRSTLGKRVWG